MMDQKPLAAPKVLKKDFIIDNTTYLEVKGSRTAETVVSLIFVVICLVVTGVNIYFNVRTACSKKEKSEPSIQVDENNSNNDDENIQQVEDAEEA